MENAIFYTFSTIPQVLAGAIALIGVFAIFKVQNLNNTMLGYAKNFLSQATKSGQWLDFYDLALDSQNLAELKSLMEVQTEKEPKVQKKDRLRRLYFNFSKNFYKKKSIMVITKITAVYTAFIILGSIIVLPYTLNILQMEHIELLFYPAFLLVAINLVLIVKIIITSL